MADIPLDNGLFDFESNRLNANELQRSKTSAQRNYSALSEDHVTAGSHVTVGISENPRFIVLICFPPPPELLLPIRPSTPIAEMVMASEI